MNITKKLSVDITQNICGHYREYLWILQGILNICGHYRGYLWTLERISVDIFGHYREYL